MSVSSPICMSVRVTHWRETENLYFEEKMSKFMQKIVLFIEPNDDAWITPLKIGNLFMNRFAVEEDAAFEVLKIFELVKTSGKMAYPGHPEFMNFEEERKQKGMDHTTKINVYSISRSTPDKNVYSIWERFWAHKKRLVGLEMRQV